MVFPIKNRIYWKEGETNDDVQSAKGAVQCANFALNLPLKCKFPTNTMEAANGIYYAACSLQMLLK